MSNWKRFIALGLSAMMMSAALAGCGSTDSSTAADGETAEADTEAGRVRVGGREYSFDGYTGFIAELVEAGGLMNLVREGRF